MSNTRSHLTSGARRFWDRVSRPARELRWRLARWSTSSDRQFHDGIFGAQQHDPFSPSYPGNLTIRRFADLAEQRLDEVRSVLDLGCGPGEITCELARRRPDIAFTGFDHSPVAIERARQHAKTLELRNVLFEVADLERFTPAEPVDLIAMFDAFHHVLDPAGFVTRLRPLCQRFFLIEPAGSWTGQWERRRDLDWLPATIMQIAERLEYELEVPAFSPPLSSTEPAGPGAPSRADADATEHRYTMTDFERFFDGFCLEVRGTIAGLEQYGARPYERSSLRDRIGSLTYDLVVGLEETLVQEGLDLVAKHWAIFATSAARTGGSFQTRPRRTLPPRPAMRALLPPYAALYESYAGPAHARALEAFRVSLRISNTGWRGWSSSDNQPVFVSYHWLDADGRTLVHDGIRTALALEVPPGRDAVIDIHVQAPPAAGQCVLAIDLVHEGVTWFSDQGVLPYRAAFRIDP